jgi:ElaB/YqjD/DUF883 family membrane-anchored ribosome-binding protein
MATQSVITDDTTRRTSSKTDEGVAQTVRNVADSVAGAAGDVSARVPEVAQSTREAFSEATRIVQRGSDQTLKVVGAASVGFAVGLLVGGANRLLVIASLIPAALIGATMVDRNDGGTDASRNRTARV